jgi:septum formation protein
MSDSRPLPPHLILASASPRRRAMLEALGLVLQVKPAHTEELLIPGEDPRATVLRLAEEKAAVVTDAALCVLAADTIVVCDGEILGKAGSPEEAYSMWRKLAGRTHQVITGVTLRMPDGRREGFCEVTDVTFRLLASAELDAHAAAGDWQDKAGAYAVQGNASAWTERISGSYTNVVGLPLAQVVEALYRLHPEWPALPWSPQDD